MPKLPAVKPKIGIRALRRNGFVVHHTTGSHYFLKKEKLGVSIHYHNKDLKPGTVASIIAQAGLTVEEFVSLVRRLKGQRTALRQLRPLIVQ